MNRYNVIHGKNPREILRLREEFAAVGTALKIKTGVETFDCDFRERVDILMNNTDFGVGGEEENHAQ